ncbi:MAG: serine hydrolase [Patescibacteria group bacterium]|mgnify:CR=1 FL=1
MDDQNTITEGPEIRLFIILLCALLLLFVASFIFDIGKRDASTSSGVASKAFPEVNISARAAYVYDIRKEIVLYAKNEDTRLSLASLTKVMTALVAEDLNPLHSTVTINTEALRAEGDSGLYKDEKWSLKDILDFSLISSSNDGMRAVALALGAISRSNATTEEIITDFVREMNMKASELGLKNTYFWNETGLDESDVKGGAYGTAKDMSMLFEYILKNKPELIEATKESVESFSSLDRRTHTAKNTNIITSKIPGLLASKTGSTDTAGGNLIIIFDPELGRPIIVSVLGSTEEGRFKDVEILVNATMKYIENN